MYKGKLIDYGLLYFIIEVIYTIVGVTPLKNDLMGIQALMMLSLVFLVVHFIFGIAKAGFRRKKLIDAVICAGIIMRIGCMLYSDLIFPYPEGSGTMKVFSCFFSCGILYVINDLCRELKLRIKARLIVVSLIAFLPAFFISAGRFDNNAPAAFFMSVVILYTIKWHNDISFNNTVILALSIGLGMIFKLSAAVMVLYAAVFICEALYRNYRTEKFKEVFNYTILFSAIFTAFAVWAFTVNKALILQPSTLFAFKLNDLITGSNSIFRRLLYFPVTDMFKNVFVDSNADFNISLYLIKSSIFDEFSFKITYIIPLVLFVCRIIILAFSIFAGIYLIFNKSEKRLFVRFGLTGCWLIIYFCFILFNFNFPYLHFMSYRYVSVLSVLEAVFTALIFQNASSVRNRNKYRIKLRAIQFFYAVIITFSSLSVVMYCFIE